MSDAIGIGSVVPIDVVGHLLRDFARRLVMPRFRALRAGDVIEKAPGEVVTIVDREVEQALGLSLQALLPGSRVIGEEGVAENPGLLDDIARGWVWLVDPLDGTANFVAGLPSFAMMVALLHDGLAIASWIYAPVNERLAAAEIGRGAFINGRASRLLMSAPGEDLRGIVKTRFLPQDCVTALARVESGLQFEPGSGSAGMDYLAMLDGQWQFLLYWRTLAWDHVPGALLICEAGGRAARLDGGAYSATCSGVGLLVAAHGTVWQTVRDILPPVSA
ncbi:MAG: inositol monophosphatase [Rhodocyclales bacterium]|nr:inositol monophosphatase [Rhodocyclales bacterium]